MKDPFIPALKEKSSSFLTEHSTEIWSILAILVVLWFLWSYLKQYLPKRNTDFAPERVVSFEEGRRIAILRQQEQLQDRAKNKDKEKSTTNSSDKSSFGTEEKTPKPEEKKDCFTIEEANSSLQST